VKNVYIKKGIVLIVILLALFCVYPSSTGFKQDVKLLVFNNGNILYVGGSGEGNYSKIQDAVDNASSGDTIFVFDDSSPYHENIIINKSIFLIGEDKNLVVIDGDFKDMVITITTDDVFVSGFTMIHPHTSHNDWDSALVDIISSENVTIKDSIMHQYEVHYGANNAGIILRNSSYCFIQNNTVITELITQRAHGIVLMLGSTLNNISSNEIHKFMIGIYIEDCSDNIFYMNYLHHNRKGLHINFGYNNTIVNNIINFNAGGGIRFDGGFNSVISGNIITDNGEGDDIDQGIGIVGGSGNYISNNHISNNNPYGINIISINNIITNNEISHNNIGVYCNTGYNNHINKNNFITNKKNGYFEVGILYSRNYWDKNYWNKPRFMPYPVFGKIIGLLNVFRWINFDWRPALKLYEI